MRVILMQKEYYYFRKQPGQSRSTYHAMSRKGGVKMGMEIAGTVLAPALFVLKFPVALTRAPGKITYGSGGRVKDFALHEHWSMQHCKCRR
jgi:hypothetical protein